MNFPAQITNDRDQRYTKRQTKDDGNRRPTKNLLGRQNPGEKYWYKHEGWNKGLERERGHKQAVSTKNNFPTTRPPP